MMPKLSFAYLRKINTARAAVWHKAHPWNGSDWVTATTGEWGEAANVVKKLRRAEDGIRGANDPSQSVLLSKLAEELADTVTYLDQLAAHYGIDLSEAIIAKFNAVSAREGFAFHLDYDVDGAG